MTNPLLNDFLEFCPNFLKIKLKSGKTIPFQLNRAQLFSHQRLENQLNEMGRVRAIVLKGRQVGFSTLIQARYFHKIVTRKGQKAFILSHETEATKNIFDMTKRFYENLPKGWCPPADKSSSKELKFNSLESEYAVGTARNKGVGRGQTVQLFHGSEVAFWPAAEDHGRGILQAVADEDNTEIILESTANGMGNYFHSMWLAAMSGSSEYQAIFLPWYWMLGYKNYDSGFKPDEEERLLLDCYEDDGLSEEHLAWRRVKIATLSKDIGAGIELFKSEYPMNAEEAFRNAIDNVFISSQYVLKARMNDVDSEANLIIGVDPAIANSDRTAIIRRKGRLAYNLDAFRNSNTMETVGKVRHIIETERPTKVFIDCIGIGAGIVDRLREMGFNQVVGVNVARSANLKDKFRNLRAELWSDMREWLAQELPVQIPDSDELHGELCSLGYKYNSNGQLVIESKDDLRARGMPSPDLADALALTFYNGQYANENAFTPNIIPQQHRGMFY
jgi:hypothetical protein